MTTYGNVSTVFVEAALGNLKTLPFRLRRKGTILNWDVSAATKIILESNLVGQSAMAPIVANNAAPGADWANGLVPIQISSIDVTARVGTYEFWVTVYMGADAKGAFRGTIEVLPRPVFTPFPMPGGGAYLSTDVLQGTNASDTVTIPQGAPVARVGDGQIALATADSAGAMRADGIAMTAIPPETPGLYFGTGSLALPDWTTITGAADLVDGASYYLDKVAGKLTTTLPSRPDFSLLQLIGEAADTRTLDLLIGTYELDL